MLSKITWHEWWLFIATATATYYVLITVLFFRKGLAHRLSGRRRTRGLFPGQPPDEEDKEDMDDAQRVTEEQHSQKEEPQNQDEEEPEPIATNKEPGFTKNAADEETEVAENLAFMDTISEAISQSLSPYNGYANKEEVILKLAQVLREYKEAPAYELYEEAIDWHMNEQVRLFCGTSLSDNDLHRIRDIAASQS